jgi:hypothetical protein
LILLTFFSPGRSSTPDEHVDHRRAGNAHRLDQIVRGQSAGQQPGRWKRRPESNVQSKLIALPPGKAFAIDLGGLASNIR